MLNWMQHSCRLYAEIQMIFLSCALARAEGITLP